jgi:hypothetical protein
MIVTDYTVNISVKQSAASAFRCIKDIAGWWTVNVEGQSQQLDDVFTVHFGETFITIKVIELVPDKKIGWQVIDCYKHWLTNKKEWRDTIMSWEITTANNDTQINFTHIGLLPGIECYEGCEKAWNFYVQKSLFKLLTVGKGIPELK